MKSQTFEISFDLKAEDYPTMDLKKSNSKKIIALGAPLLKEFIQEPLNVPLQLVDFRKPLKETEGAPIGIGVIVAMASRPIKKGTKIGTYRGERADDKNIQTLYPKAEVEDMNAYSFLIKAAKSGEPEESVYAHSKGNFARFINHNGSDPNLTITVDPKTSDISIFANRILDPGEQLTFNYGPKYTMGQTPYYIPSSLNHLHPANFYKHNKPYYDLEHPRLLDEKTKMVLGIQSDYVLLSKWAALLFAGGNHASIETDYVKRLPLIELQYDNEKKLLHILTKQHHITPLHFAAAIQDRAAFNLLLAANVDVLARTHDHLDIFQILLNTHRNQVKFIEYAKCITEKIQEKKLEHIELGFTESKHFIQRLLERNWHNALRSFSQRMYFKTVVVDHLDVIHLLLRNKQFHLLDTLLNSNLKRFITFNCKQLTVIYNEFEKSKVYEQDSKALSAVTLSILEITKFSGLRKNKLIQQIVADAQEQSTVGVTDRLSSSGRKIKNKNHFGDTASSEPLKRLKKPTKKSIPPVKRKNPPKKVLLKDNKKRKEKILSAPAPKETPALIVPLPPPKASLKVKRKNILEPLKANKKLKEKTLSAPVPQETLALIVPSHVTATPAIVLPLPTEALELQLPPPPPVETAFDSLTACIPWSFDISLLAPPQPMIPEIKSELTPTIQSDTFAETTTAQIYNPDLEALQRLFKTNMAFRENFNKEAKRLQLAGLQLKYSAIELAPLDNPNSFVKSLCHSLRTYLAKGWPLSQFIRRGMLDLTSCKTLIARCSHRCLAEIYLSLVALPLASNEANKAILDECLPLVLDKKKHKTKCEKPRRPCTSTKTRGDSSFLQPLPSLSPPLSTTTYQESTKMGLTLFKSPNDETPAMPTTNLTAGKTTPPP